MPDEKKVEPEVAPSADPPEAEDGKPIEAKRPEPKLAAPIKEEIQSHDTTPPWAQAILDKLDELNKSASAKPASKEVVPEVAPKVEAISEQREVDDGKKTEKPKSRKINLWRTF